MKWFSFLLVLLTSLGNTSFAEKSPNILLIYTDDHGWSDIGAQGVDKDIKTPNLDQLVRDGVLCKRGYVTAPQCVPSRAGVLTGRYQQRFGVEDNNKGPLPLSEITIAERLKPANYLSGFVGKSHLDIGSGKGIEKRMRILKENLPHQQGFDEYWRGELRDYYASHALDGTPFNDAPRLVVDNRFRVEVQTEAALSFLDRRIFGSESPWFLYLAWYAPHVPLESPEPWFSKTPSNLPKERRQALAMLAAMDDGLGRLRAKLKDMGQYENTLIFLIGDNGAPLKPGAWNGSLNSPMVGEKGMLTDGGIRTPFIVSWPAVLPKGISYSHPVSSLDVAATANAVAGLPEDIKLDGVNLIPFLSGEKQNSPHDLLYWRWRSQAAVLEYPWKLILVGEKERFLFDVSKRDGETAVNNKLAEEPEIAQRLENRLEAWCEQLQPPGPAEKFNQQDLFFYDFHVNKKSDSEVSGKGSPSTISSKRIEGEQGGWVCRNGNLVVDSGCLRIMAASGDKRNTFIARTGFELSGKSVVLLNTRSKHGGTARIAWRTNEESFAPHQVTTFQWPKGDQWQEVSVPLSDKNPILHLRIHFPDGTDQVEINSIEVNVDGKLVYQFMPRD